MITSTHNPRIQRVRALLGKSGQRRETGFFIIEGVRLVEEALASGWPVEEAFFMDGLSDRGQEAVGELAAAGTPVEQVAPHVMDALSEAEASQGLLGVMPIRSLPLPSLFNFAVVADAIRDPGNLGTVLRTAAAAGVQAVFLAPGTTDAFAPKVVRSAMGAHFHLPILRLDWPEISHRLKDQPQSLALFLADVAGGQPYWEADLCQPCALVIGGEAEGASPAARQVAAATIHIPMPGGTESLNAAAAAAVLIFEVVRQRSTH